MHLYQTLNYHLIYNMYPLKVVRVNRNPSLSVNNLVIIYIFQLTEADQDLYRNFPLLVSERWQQEVAETVFDAINADTDKLELKRKQKPGSDSSYYQQDGKIVS